jgi:hypothetical protein
MSVLVVLFSRWRKHSCGFDLQACIVAFAMQREHCGIVLTLGVTCGPGDEAGVGSSNFQLRPVWETGHSIDLKGSKLRHSVFFIFSGMSP